MSAVQEKIVIGVLGLILAAVMVYGDYRYYFCKPTPIVNTITVAAGGKLEQVQAVALPKSLISGHLITGVSAGKGTIMGTIGWLW